MKMMLLVRVRSAHHVRSPASDFISFKPRETPRA